MSCRNKYLSIFIGLVLIHAVTGLLCYSCNSYKQGHDLCGRTSSLTRHNTKHIVECSGYCKVATFRRRGGVHVHLRMCDLNATRVGCQEISRGKETKSMCICGHDYCNIDLHNSKSPKPVALSSMTSDSPSRSITFTILGSIAVALYIIHKYI